MAQSVSYIKTLVIGLGSTGTRVCNELVRRIEWEMGSLERAPWVSFLAVETRSFSEMIPQRVTEGERLASAQYGFDVHTTPPRNLSLSHPPVSPVRPTRPRQPLPPQDLRFPLHPLSTLPTLPA